MSKTFIYVHRKFIITNFICHYYIWLKITFKNSYPNVIKSENLMIFNRSIKLFFKTVFMRCDHSKTLLF